MPGNQVNFFTVENFYIKQRYVILVVGPYNRRLLHRISIVVLNYFEYTQAHAIR